MASYSQTSRPLPATHIFQVHQAYISLLPSTNPHPDPQPADLGGQLLYLAELDPTASPLIRAANIAGAASLAASADASALIRAQREGVIDFLVNTLDEALRILKNEIRKRQPVAVAVSLAPHTVTQEMLDRGVLPDLLPRQSTPDFTFLAPFLALGAKLLPAPTSNRAHQLHIWPIPVAYTNRPAEFEAILATHLSPEDHFARRWLHLSPRYLEAAARRFRSIAIDTETQEKLTARFGPPLKP